MKIRYALYGARHSRVCCRSARVAAQSHRHAGFSIAGSEGRYGAPALGQELTGTVRSVDSKLLHLGSLAGREFLTRSAAGRDRAVLARTKE